MPSAKIDQKPPLERQASNGLEELDPAMQFAVTWRNLSFSVTKKKETKVIVNDVFGHCKPKQMMAIMGPSGCGKTSLLDLLGDRVASGKREGEILLGSEARDPGTARKIVSYVMQEDALLTAFTVRETLRYSARLCLASAGAAKRERRVTSVIEQMGLTTAADTRVGDPLIKGLSGGQKRRLSIAIELLQGSPVLLLDEPTSGLDSTAALQVVEHLKSVADKGHTIIMSIHQASSKSYQMFDLLYLMSRGKQVYFGPTGTEAVDYFAQSGKPCPEFTNPAEFFLDVLNTDFGSSVAEVDELALKYAQSDLAKSLKGSSGQGAGWNDPKAAPLSVGRAGAVMQFFVLLQRMTVMNAKNPYIFLVRIVMYVALAFMVGTMYWMEGETARTAIPAAEWQAMAGSTFEEVRSASYSLLPLLFYVQAFLVFMSVAILPFFLEQRDVFRRERANGQITCGPYVIADFLAGLPGVAMIAVISSLLVVYLADLNGFGHFLLNLLLSLIVAEALMHVIGAAQPHYIIGMAFGAGLFGMFMLCEGFMVPKDEIPAGWIWGYYLAFHSYSFEWFMWNQFHGEDGGPFGAQILTEYDIEDVDPLRNALILGGYALVLEIAFFVVLYVFHTGRR